MGYCTVADVQVAAGGADNLRELSDWNKKGDVDSAVVQSHIAMADAMIKSKIQVRHAIPDDSEAWETIRWTSARMAVFELKRSRGMLSDNDVATHEMDMAWLAGFKGGDTTPGQDPVPAVSEYAPDNYTARSDDEDVSRDALKGFA